LSDRGVEQIERSPQEVKTQRTDADAVAGQAGVQLLLHVSAERLVDCVCRDGCRGGEDQERSDQYDAAATVHGAPSHHLDAFKMRAAERDTGSVPAARSCTP